MKKIITILILMVLSSTMVFGSMTKNETTTSRGKGEYIAYDVSMQIKEGWNFISFPAGLDFNLGGNILNGELKYGYLYSILENRYVPLYKDNIYTQSIEPSEELMNYWNKYNPQTDVEMIKVSGSIMWIYSEKAGTINYEHIFIDDFYKFHDGVNVISATPDVIKKILTSSYGDCVVEDVIHFDTEQNKWFDWDTNKELNTGEGVAFIVEDECDLNKGNNMPPAMPMPN